jgi:peptide/nickel transport system permease protein
MFSLARFDLGYSSRFYPVRVTELISASVVWTAALMGVTTLIAFVAGSLLGAFLGWAHAPAFAKYVALPAMVLSVVPYYLLGLILSFLFSFEWRIFPSFGGYGIGVFPDRSLDFALNVLYHALLPAVSIVLGAMGFWALYMRGLLVGLQGEDFMVYGEAKGLRGARLFFQYAVRNALLPQATGLGISLGAILTGSVLVEIVFGYPGLGLTLHRAIRSHDYFVVTGIVYVVIVSIAVATFILDLIYPSLDPRIKYAKG